MLQAHWPALYSTQVALAALLWHWRHRVTRSSRQQSACPSFATCTDVDSGACVSVLSLPFEVCDWGATGAVLCANNAASPPTAARPPTTIRTMCTADKPGLSGLGAGPLVAATHRPDATTKPVEHVVHVSEPEQPWQRSLHATQAASVETPPASK